MHIFEFIRPKDSAAAIAAAAQSKTAQQGADYNADRSDEAQRGDPRARARY